MYIDSHCHLDPQAYGSWEEIDAVVDRAHSHGVRQMVAIGSGYGAESAQRVMTLIDRHPSIFAAVGIHPHDASHWTPTIANQLRGHAKHHKVKAIGEMGLDFFYNNSPEQIQRNAFVEQIRLALEIQKPIVIHDRDSNGEVFEILAEHAAFQNGVLYHCFCGSVDELDTIISAGGYISLPGIITFKNGQQMRDVAKFVPLDRLLIETDSPFLTPVPHRGKRNEPQFVRYVAQQIAKERNCSVSVIAKETTQNARHFFRLS